MSGVVRFHRIIKAPPERVHRAFLDPDAFARWLPLDGFTGRVHLMEPRGVGWQESLASLAQLVEPEIPG